MLILIVHELRNSLELGDLLLSLLLLSLCWLLLDDLLLKLAHCLEGTVA